MAKGRKYELIVEQVEITGVADKGRGVGRDTDGVVLFVEQVAPGDVVDVRIRRFKPEFMEGVAVRYHRVSEHRIPPFCEHFNVCGGCRWQHVDYQAQVFYKERVVRDAIYRIGKVEPEEFLPIVPCENILYYRNKLEFAFSQKRWLTQEEFDAGVPKREDVLGFHRPGAFDKIVDIHHCWLQDDPSNELRLTIKEIAIAQGLSFFDLRANAGLMRHIVIRLTTLGELMLIVSFGEKNREKIKLFLDEVIARMPRLTSVFYCINPKANDFVLDLDMVCYHGKNHILEQLGPVRFKIGPKSFFQTNSFQAKVLYDKVVEFAGLRSEDNVYDLYTGVGSIALYVSRFCRQVVGVEEVSEAIADAEENAHKNGIENCIFYAGDVKDVLTAEFSEQHGKPDVVITDPPRAGMHPVVVKVLLGLEAPRIVYVSCNPATQARDIRLLLEKYVLQKIQPVDMFPHTHHVETVALLTLRT